MILSGLAMKKTLTKNSYISRPDPKLLFIVLCIGCAHISTNLYKDSPTYPPTDPSNVSVYHRKPQNVNFVELGEITVSEVNSWKDAEKALKEGAAKIGGDAVYIITQNSKSEGVIVPLYMRDAVSNWDTQLIVTGVVIKYME